MNVLSKAIGVVIGTIQAIVGLLSVIGSMIQHSHDYLQNLIVEIEDWAQESIGQLPDETKDTPEK